MRILYFSPHPHLNLSDPTGYATHMREMISAFRQKGHEVFPVIAGGTELNKQVSLSEVVSFFRRLMKFFIPKLIWSSIKDHQLVKIDQKLCEELKSHIKSFNPDLIYERKSYLQVSGLTAAKEFGITHIMEMNAPHLEERMKMSGKSLYKTKAESFEKWQLENTSKIVVVSSALKDYLLKKYQITDSKVLITPNAVNATNTVIDENKIKALRNQLALEGNLIIGFVGSVFPYHGVDILIRSFAEIADQYKNVKLLIVGDGEILSELKELCIHLKIDDRVCFTGNVSNKDIYYHIDLMDVCVMARSNWYGSPVKIFEYGIMKKAIIAPETIPVKDVFNNGEHAILIPPEQDGLTKALKKLLNDEQLRYELGVKAYEKILKQHTWKEMAGKILIDYE